jgi:hypothetical protein
MGPFRARRVTATAEEEDLSPVRSLTNDVALHSRRWRGLNDQARGVTARHEALYEAPIFYRARLRSLAKEREAFTAHLLHLQKK